MFEEFFIRLLRIGGKVQYVKVFALEVAVYYVDSPFGNSGGLKTSTSELMFVSDVTVTRAGAPGWNYPDTH